MATTVTNKSFVTEEIQLSEKEFCELSHQQLLEIFTKYKNLSVEVGKHRLDLTYISGNKYGIKFTEVISFQHVEKLPRYYIDKEDSYRTVTDKPISPLSFSQAVKKFSAYYKRLKQGKIMKVKDLTEDEIDEIVRIMNQPIGDADD